MLTVDFHTLRLVAGDRVLDLGCGGGRHAFELYRRGADVVAVDTDASELSGVQDMFTAMSGAGEGPADRAGCVRADARRLPFPDGAFDRIVAAEVLEHIPADRAAIAELTRVLRPGGTLAVTVPREWPERMCWWLSDAYHANEGGHVRIYDASDLTDLLTRAGLEVTGRSYAHALHSPYWWLKCAVGVNDDDHPLVRAYHRVLVWDLMRRPALTRRTEKLLDPVMGKSLVLYARKRGA